MGTELALFTENLTVYYVISKTFSTYFTHYFGLEIVIKMKYLESVDITSHFKTTVKEIILNWCCPITRIKCGRYSPD